MFHVEKDPDCRRLLNYHFPKSKSYGDIFEFDGTEYRGAIDIISGGFPCQPFSTAGKMRGREDDRYLWPEMDRIIGEIRPSWIIGENTPKLITMDNGSIFEEICTSLESKGYEVWAALLPACAVGAPHKRERVWILAYNGSAQREGGKRKEKEKSGFGSSDKSNEVKQHSNHNGINSNLGGFGATAKTEWEKVKIRGWESPWFQVASRLCRVDDGIPAWVDIAPSKRLRGIGNAVVPQIPYIFFEAIKQLEL